MLLANSERGVRYCNKIRTLVLPQRAHAVEQTRSIDIRTLQQTRAKAAPRFGESSRGQSYQMLSMLVAYPECWRARAAGGTAHRHADERGTQRIPRKRPTPSLRRVRLDRRP